MPIVVTRDGRQLLYYDDHRTLAPGGARGGFLLPRDGRGLVAEVTCHAMYRNVMTSSPR